MDNFNEDKVVNLALDIGKASIGFALVDTKNNYKIIKSGVRIFDAPEKPKEQTSLQKERGEYKRARNSNENEFFRTKQVVKCLLTHNILDAEIIRKYDKSPKVKNIPKSKKKHLFYIKTAEFLFYKKSKNQDILHLRVKALYSKLSDLELARLLYSMNKHRGVTYDDIAEVKEGSVSSLTPDQKDLKAGIKKYNDEYKNINSNYLTVGEYLKTNYSEKFRNTNKNVKGKKPTKNYLFSIPRDDLKSEIETIFEKQREFGNLSTTQEFQDEYLQYFLWEKASPKYDMLVAPCIYNHNEKSANKHHFSSSLYISIEKLYNMRYKQKSDKNYQNFTLVQIIEILNNSFEKLKGISYKDIKNILNLKDIEFKGILEEDTIVCNFETFIRIKKIFNLDINPLEDFKNEAGFIQNDLVDMVKILAYETKDSLKKEEFKNLGISNENIEALLKIKIRGHLSYSLGVVDKLCNYMLNGNIPYDAKQKVEDEYGVKTIERQLYLPPILDTDFPLKNNHTVLRALSQVRTVINDILKYYRKKIGNPNWTFDTVTIELAREMNSKKQITSINKLISQNTKANQEAIELCEKYNIINPTQMQILKAKLYKLQNAIDPYVWIKNDENKNVDSYTLGRIEANSLFVEGYCEVDHTLPFSRSLDDSQSNKVLVLSQTNQNKGDKTPHEYLDKDEFEKFEKYLREKSNYLSYGDARIRKLLNKDFKGIDGFTQKDIVNTQIISKYAGLYINNHLQFWSNPNFDGKRRIFANNGKITTILRKSWAIGKKNRDTHLHHAEDAILIACSTPSLIKNIATFINIQTQLTSGKLTLKKFDFILRNHNSLKKYILENLEKENIDIENIDTKNPNEVKDLLSKIFKVIANKNYPYDGFKEDFKKSIGEASVTHFVKHKNNGSIHTETIVKKIPEKKQKGVEIRGGIAGNDEYIRCDVFKITNDKNKVHYDFVVLTAIEKGKKVEELPSPILKTNENASFMFSVFKNELLSYSLKDGSQIKANFVKVASSIIVREPSNFENKLFRRQVKDIYSSFSKTDDVEELKSIIEDTSSDLKLSLLNVAKLSTQIEKIKLLCLKVYQKIKSKYNINTIFLMEQMSSIQTKELRDKLLAENIIKEVIEIDNKLTQTIFITLSASGYVPSSRADGQTKLIDLCKLEINSMGEYKTITKEIRKPL